MWLRERLTRKHVVVGSAVIAMAIVILIFVAVRRPPRALLERYAPATALIFIQADSLADLFDGFSETPAWRELAPTLGLSEKMAGSSMMAGLIGRAGLGSDDVTIAARAQFAVVITNLLAKRSDDGESLQLRPHLALIVETHSSPELASRVSRERGAAFARNVYGDSTVERTELYQGREITTYQGPEPDRQVVVAASESRILIGNEAAAVKSCLDAIEGRAAALSGDRVLSRFGQAVERGAPIFGYVTESGVQNLLALAPALLAGRISADPDSIASASNLFEHLSKQAASGLLYSAEFTGDGVSEKYLGVLRPQVASGLAAAMKAAPEADLESPRIAPRELRGFTIWNVERVGEIPERALKQLTPALDTVAGLALREFVLDLRKTYGLDPVDSVGDFTGSELAMLDFGDEQPRALLLRATDQQRLYPAMLRYLKSGGAKASTEEHNGVEIGVSSNEDSRAAAFISGFLVLATREQVKRIIDAHLAGEVLVADDRFMRAAKSRPSNAPIFSYGVDTEDAAGLMLALSRAAGAGDGSPELLDQETVRAALEKLPPSISFTHFRDSGIYIESRSAVGNLSVISSLLAGREE
jgi:hypothetical protein